MRRKPIVDDMWKPAPQIIRERQIELYLRNSPYDRLRLLIRRAVEWWVER